MESKAEARLHGQIAAYESWARTPDRAARVAPARAGMEAKFVNEVDPDGVLDEAELALRVAAARKAYYARLSRLAAKARRERRGG
jgi:hypothetical protein